MRAVQYVVAIGIALAFVLGLTSGASVGQRSASARPRDLGRSTIIYPPQRIALRMDHSLPAHRELECARCHDGAPTSESSADRLIPAERTCLPCHAREIDRATPTIETCGTCHMGFVPPPSDAGAPIAPVSDVPAARLRFSHRAHVQAGQTCLDCHAGVPDARLATRAHLPTMRDCFRCHAPSGLGDVPAAPRPLACEGCHVANPSGQLHARWPEGWMNPPRWMAGMRHDHEWLVRHRWVAADQGPLCAECHTESDCTDCHDGRVRPRRVHPSDFLTVHPVYARRDGELGTSGGRCTSCHTISQFCAECHGRLGIAPIAAPDVRTRDRWHPPTAVWVRGPNMHAIEAVRSMQSCASCHAEEDCVQCHGARGIGAGVSPHPPGFAMSCRGALETNARACITCHGDVEELRARCR
ncbi:cytochrome c3 family protein [Sandaracinus amylolyticus]|uniref:cytochrome c3 family protein n=1 Tax=Sandaracinus amylolyticus TaxID=927083 RepID=UPI001F47B3B6|nr:cytochrome c3 family protein [Sandaracinus amylolyticus]UJR80897.1 Cytochrome c family protein [Sandaracinus amylolyticus]